MLTIRLVTEEELPLLGWVHARAWQAAHEGIVSPGFLRLHTPQRQTEKFRAALSPPGERQYYLAFWADKPAGMLGLDFHPGTALGEIERLYLLPEFQGRGIGGALLRFGLEKLSHKGEIFLWVMNVNQRAQGFYEKMGFCFTGAEKVINPRRGLTAQKYIWRGSPLWKGSHRMNLCEKLQLLCEATGVSGDEGAACRVAERLLKEYTGDVRVDRNQNVIANVYDAGPDKPRLLLDAHIDEIGLLVTHIEEGGFVHVEGIGVDRRLLLAQEVILHGEREIPGVILAKAPHLTTSEEREQVPEVKDLLIDTGYEKEELEKILAPGDRVTLKSRFTRLQGDHVSSKALDDRGCVACILAALEELKGKELPVSLTVLFSSQEEVGCRGAMTGAYAIDADMAIAVDVSFAMTPDADKNRCGQLGEGPMVGISPILDRGIWQRLIRLAQEQDIPFQREVMSGSTGTNADCIATSRGGVRTGLVSLPQRYMHTPIEVVRLCDIEAVGRLLAAFVLDQKVGGESE